MRRRALRVFVITVEVLAVLLAVGAAALGYGAYRLNSGPVPLGLFRPSIQIALGAQLPRGFALKIGDIQLERSADRGAFNLIISDPRVLGADNQQVAAADRVVIEFAAAAMSAQDGAPKSVFVSGAEFRLVRSADQQRIKVAGATRRTETPITRIMRPLVGGGVFKSGFERAVIADAHIELFDEASARAWIAPAATITILRDGDAIDARLDGAIGEAAATADFSAAVSYRLGDEHIHARIDGANFPVSAILTTLYGDSADVIDASISGDADLRFATDGSLAASKINASIGAGALRLPTGDRPFETMSLTMAFDPKVEAFSIEAFDVAIGETTARIVGSIALSFASDNRQIEKISFALNSPQTTMDLRPILSEKTLLRDIALSGEYDLASRRLAFGNASISTYDIVAHGAATLEFARRDHVAQGNLIGINAALDVDGALSSSELISLWPVGVADGAREWVVDRLDAATIYNIKATAALAPGAIAPDGGMPDEAITVTFDARNGSARYVDEMTPLTDARGSGVLRGNSFKMSSMSANVGLVAITEGEVDFPVFMPKWQPTYFRFVATGAAENMLAILDQEPLTLLSDIELSPDQFNGPARARVEIMRPNKSDVAPEEYEYRGTATFSDLSVKKLFGDAELQLRKGSINLQPRYMTVQADGHISDDPVSISWRQNFYQEEDGPATFSMNGRLGASTADLFGVGTRQFLHGPTDVKIEATGEIGDFSEMDINVNLVDASVFSDVLGWQKPAGEPGVATAKIIFEDDKAVFEDVSMAGEGFEVAGTLELSRDGKLLKASLPKVDLTGAASVQLNAFRDENDTLQVTALGGYLNLAPAITELLDSDDRASQQRVSPWGAGLNLQARIDRIGMRNGVEYDAAALDLWRDGERLQALDFSAAERDGAALKVTLSHTGDEVGPAGVIVARSNEIGDLMAGVFGLESIAGGDGTLKIGIRTPDETRIRGAVEARNFRIVNAPLLARLFAAGSFDGLSNLLNGEGVDFDYAYGEFSVDDSVLTIDEARMTGSSVGVTARGRIGSDAAGGIAINGAVAPIYQLNSALGAAPIIGDILVGKRGEGILALSYAVSGTADAPTVTVNPLSALTPGVFRGLFQSNVSIPEDNAIETPTEPSQID